MTRGPSTTTIPGTNASSGQREGAPEAFAAFAAFDEVALRGAGKKIPRKYTELIALAVALTTQCVYCIEGHTEAARREGADEAELAEAILTTAALRAGGGFAHGLMAMRMYRDGESDVSPT